MLAGWGLWYIHQPIRLTYNLESVNIHSPLKVTFSHQVGDHLNYNLSPAIGGTWKATHGLFGISAIAFYPSHPLEPGSTYKLTLGNVTQLASTKPLIPVETLAVSAQKPASIASISPAASSSGIAVSTAVTLALASTNQGLRELSLSSDAPLTSSVPKTTDNRHYTWAFKQPLQQATTYHLNLTDLKQHGAAQHLLATSFTTVAEPKITTATQQSHFYPGTVVTIGFDQAMQQTPSDFQFGMGGSGHWTSPQTYQFTPTGLTPGQTYTYTVLKGAKAINGGIVEADHPYQISTPGPAYVTGGSPSGGGLGVGTAISVTFDQPVDHTSAQAAFSISPGVGGSFSWSSNTMTFHPTGLAYQTTYSFSVGPGVKGTYGLPGTSAYSHSFSTTYQVIKLNVPQLFQAYTESCEEAALRMALAMYNINVSDYDILQRVGYNPTPRNIATNTWDNPYQMFVGDVNGIQDSTGYGVFAPPIAAAAQSYGRGATVANGVSASYIAQQIYNGHPVIAWGYSVNPSADDWNVPGGGSISAYKGEHVRVVYGVAGSPGNIIGFYIHDPFYGNLYWTPGQLMANMNIFGATSNQTVTVY